MTSRKPHYENVDVVHTYRVPVGYYWVTFIPVYQGENEDGFSEDAIASVDAEVRRVTRADTHLHDMTEETNADPTYSDTHDLRDRLFRTKREADAHAKQTVHRFEHPQPWESFVKLR